MCKAVSFYINSTQNANGPSVFGHRLKGSLLEMGWRWRPLLPSVNYIFASGLFRPIGRNIVRLDGLYFDSMNTTGDSNNKNRPIFKACRRADGIVFQSEFDRSLFRAFADEISCPSTIINNGAPSGFSSEGERIEYGFEKTIICSSSWRAHKRLACIINGFLEYTNPKVGLVVLGECVQAESEHPNIKYMGKIHPQELPVYLRGADAFVHLSWLDHCPNTVVEALKCGLPVLCSHNGGTREIVRDNGVVMQFEEDFDFKKVDLYNPPRCDRRLVAKGIEQILNWDKRINASYLDIENVAGSYADFAVGLL